MQRLPDKKSIPKMSVKHTGGCHCGQVRFHVFAPKILNVSECNCSICTKKQIRNALIVPQNQFFLDCGQESLTEYRFNTGTARHLFCKVCGVQSFYRPRSNPDGVSVMTHCLDPGTVEEIRPSSPFDGQNWEEAFARSPPALQKDN